MFVRVAAPRLGVGLSSHAVALVFGPDSVREARAMVTAIPHTSQEFEQELNALGERLVAMGVRAEHQVVRAMKALLDRDDAVADEVIAGDAAINADENEIDAEALQLLARNQPVAGDLRFIAMCLEAVIDIERIGDLAVDTARRASRCYERPRRSSGSTPRWRER